MKLWRDPQSLLTALCGVTLLLSVFLRVPWLPYVSVAAGSVFALRTAWDSLRERSLDVNFLMVFAAAGSVIVGRPIEAAILLFLFSLSSTLEAFAMSRTRSAIEALIHLRPDRAIRIGKSGDESVLVEDLRIGDRVRVLPFEQVAIDGLVLEGATSVNQAALTGESEPITKMPGDKVFGGTSNLEGALILEVTAEVGGTVFEKIVAMVQEAQDNKASGERVSQWFGKRYTLFVIAAFLVSWVVRLAIGQHGDDALYGALSLLVALSPCALVISTPASTLSALAFAARRGVLVRGGEFIEALGNVNAIALDKTGTLTRGTFTLAEICLCATGDGKPCREAEGCWRHEESMSAASRDVLGFAASVEQYSTHPIAQAIVRAARDQGVPIVDAKDSIAHPGLGVTAIVNGRHVKAGQRRFFEEGDLELPEGFIPHVEEIQHRGMSVVIVETEGSLAALGLRDEPRPGAKETLDQLRSLGVRSVVMITGDHSAAAEAVAREIGITEVHAGLMPEGKAEVMAKMAAKGDRVMMVGDGINDAPVLAAAQVGVAMGGLGSDAALQAADVVLMEDRLDRIPLLIKLGRMANGIIRANLIFAAGVIIVLATGTFIFERFFPEHLNLVLPIAVVGHEGSTVLVILNGLRLLRGPSR